jgi:F0F1-type ATP synthase delta subunit
MTILKKEDKIQIIEARIKSIEYKKYSLGIDLVVENNRSEPLEEAVTKLEADKGIKKGDSISTTKLEGFENYSNSHRYEQISTKNSVQL